jgi:hypothetical protein
MQVDDTLSGILRYPFAYTPHHFPDLVYPQSTLPPPFLNKEVLITQFTPLVALFSPEVARRVTTSEDV